MKINTNNIEILTPSGFSKFDGITRKLKQTIRIKFQKGSDFICTPDHKIFMDGEWFFAREIKPNQNVNGRYVVSISLDVIQYVYDPVNVKLKNEYISDGIISHNCQFQGSSKTLLNGATLMALTTIPPIFIKDKLEYFKQPEKGRNYVITVDTSRGRHLDFSALVVVDITSLPYEVVATYKDNEISPESYPHLIYTIAKSYNDAYVLIEVNDLGEMISSNLFYEFEYENVYFTFKDVLNEGRGYPGIRTTKKVKSIGCATLKSLMEQDQLIINSHKILTEFGVFSQKGASYAADDEEINDDLMTCLWLFAWLTKQPLFAELTDTNIRSILAKKTEQYIDENMLPFGFIDDGRDAVGDIDVMQRVGGGADWLQKWILSDLQTRD